MFLFNYVVTFLIVVTTTIKKVTILIKQKHVIVEIKNKIKVCAWFNNTTTKIWGSPLKKNIYHVLRTCYHSGKSRYRRSFTILFQLRRKLSKRILSLYRSIIMPLVCMHLYTSLVSFVFSSPFRVQGVRPPPP